jgi:hypothetical protein
MEEALILIFVILLIDTALAICWNGYSFWKRFLNNFIQMIWSLLLL